METPLILGDFIALYLAFRGKHLAADYFLQTQWMARGKSGDAHWMTPLFAHASVHGLGTTLIALVFAPSLWWLGPIDVILHASIDRIKALPCLGGRWQPSQPAFWWCHGVDQEAHNLTHLAFIAVILLA